MTDFEKNRAAYVTHLELLNENLREQLAAIKAEEKWVPKFGITDEPGEGVRLTMSFAGQNITALVGAQFLLDQSATDATTKIITTGFQDFINNAFVEVIRPEVQKMQDGLRAIQSAGKW